MDSYFGRNWNTISLSPLEVRFTQDSVGMCFQNGTELNATCEDIAKGVAHVENFPSIRVRLHDDGHYYSVDNRRLYIFRVLNLLGVLPEITAKKINYFEREFTTENDGCHVRVRSRKDNNNRWQRVVIFRHCNCQYERNKKLPDWWNKQWKCHVDLVNAARIKHANQLRLSNIAGRDDITRRSLTVAPKLHRRPAEITIAEENNTSNFKSVPTRLSSRRSQRQQVNSEDSEPCCGGAERTTPKESFQPISTFPDHSMNGSTRRILKPREQPVVPHHPSPAFHAFSRATVSGHSSTSVNHSNQARIRQDRFPSQEPEEESFINQLLDAFCCCFTS